MLSAVSEDIRTLLEANLFGVSGSNLFSFEWGSGSDGEEIDAQTLVIDLDAIDSDLKELYENPVFQILVRGNRSDGAKAVHDAARDIYEFIISQPTQDINAVSYLQFEPIGGLLPIGRDDHDRFVYTMSFYTYRNPI